jgi:hypothetical protein
MSRKPNVYAPENATVMLSSTLTTPGEVPGDPISVRTSLRTSENERAAAVPASASAKVRPATTTANRRNMRGQLAGEPGVKLISGASR